jgi:hypothetical protein
MNEKLFMDEIIHEYIQSFIHERKCDYTKTNYSWMKLTLFIYLFIYLFI